MTDTQKKGREVPPIEFTFSGTGITVKIRKVSPLLRDDVDAQLRLEFPPPEIPLKKKNYGTEDQPDWIEEPDPFDAVYREKNRRWGIEHANRVGDKLLWVAVRRGIELDLDDDQRGQVEQIRLDLEAVGVKLDPDDKFVYITRVCLDSLDSLRELHDIIFSNSRPSREEVESMKATFPGNVQGEGHLQSPSPEGQGRVIRRVQLDGSVEVQRDSVAGVRTPGQDDPGSVDSLLGVPNSA